MFTPLHEKMRRETSGMGLLQFACDAPKTTIRKLIRVRPLIHQSDPVKIKALLDVQASIVKYDEMLIYMDTFKRWPMQNIE